MVQALIKFSIVAIALVMEFGIFPGMSENIINSWEAKEFLAMVMAVSIVSLFLYRRGSMRFRNPWLLLSIVYLFLHPLITPPLEFDNIYDTQIFASQMYQSTAQLLIYFMLAMVVCSIRFSRHDIGHLINIFCSLAVVTSFYCFVQAFGFDQFTQYTNNPNTINTDGKSITGTFGHPNQCGIFLAMVLPFVIYKRNLIFTISVITAICLTQSMVAIGGMVVCLGLYLYYRSNQIIRIGLAIISVIAGFVGITYALDNPSVFSGRLDIWAKSWELMTEGGRFITGYGFGSFKNVIAGLYDFKMVQMHNEPFQYFFDVGLIGICLAILSIIWLTKHCYKYIIRYERRMIFGLSFVVLMFCSLGSFVYQVEPMRFIAVLLFGYLHQKGDYDE